MHNIMSLKLGSLAYFELFLKIERGGYEIYCLQENIITGTLHYVQDPSFPIQKYSGQFSLYMWRAMRAAPLRSVGGSSVPGSVARTAGEYPIIASDPNNMIRIAISINMISIGSSLNMISIGMSVNWVKIGISQIQPE